MTVEKVIIPAAGLGTRLLTASKELPKEMLPLFALNNKGELCIKPLFELIYNQCFLEGFKKYCFIVGKQKRAIEDHFTPDYPSLDRMKKSNDTLMIDDLEIFYDRISKSVINWINQLGNFGFGHAILMGETFIGNDDFVVEAGDTLIVSENISPLNKIKNIQLEGKYDAAFLLKEVEDPRRYGVATIKQINDEIVVTNVKEKPKKPESNYAIMPIYHFKPSIFKMLKEIKFGESELQITDAIDYASWLRSKISAHRLSDLASSLSYYDVVNVQDLARRLLLEHLGFWKLA